MTKHLKVFSFGIALLALLAIGSASGRGVFAQDSTATPTATTGGSTVTDDSTSDRDKGQFKHRRGMHRGVGFHIDAEALATFLGITTEELRSEMRAGSSLAEVAEANGITRDELKTYLIEQYEAGLDALIDASPRDKSGIDDDLDSIATPETDATPAAITGLVS